jgi:hypothetical protein
MIVSDDPDIIRAMTATTSKFRRGHWYKGMGLDPRVNNTLSEQDESRHIELRRRLLPGVRLSQNRRSPLTATVQWQGYTFARVKGRPACRRDGETAG